MLRRVLGMATAVFALLVFCGEMTPLEGQILKRIKKAAEEAVQGELETQIDRMVRETVQCALNDPVCVTQAEEEGNAVVFTDDSGEVITDDGGNPIGDHEAASAAIERPGKGVWVNYDFVPGDRVLFQEDYTRDNVGDFPRRIEFLNGNMEIVRVGDTPWLRATSGSAFAIDVGQILPERFTLEFPVSWSHPGQWMRVLFQVPEGMKVAPRALGRYEFAHLLIDERETGLADLQKDGPYSLAKIPGKILNGPATIRLMADGRHVKVYVGEKRVANVPQVDLGRASKIWFVLVDATDENPMYVGTTRVAGGGADLYDKLAAEGRVTTRGLLFAVNSDRIRPESTPTLTEIGKMLQAHSELRIAIEGHTDDTGDDAHNQDLSERRAASVRQYLMREFGIEASRLEAHGFGKTKPVDTNETPEGRQNNRRVDLVKLGAP